MKNRSSHIKTEPNCVLGMLEMAVMSVVGAVPALVWLGTRWNELRPDAGSSQESMSTAVSDVWL